MTFTYNKLPLEEGEFLEVDLPEPKDFITHLKRFAVGIATNF
jgi:hypothetical protein